MFANIKKGNLLSFVGGYILVYVYTYLITIGFSIANGSIAMIELLRSIFTPIKFPLLIMYATAAAIGFHVIYRFMAWLITKRAVKEYEAVILIVMTYLIVAMVALQYTWILLTAK